MKFFVIAFLAAVEFLAASSAALACEGPTTKVRFAVESSQPELAADAAIARVVDQFSQYPGSTVLLTPHQARRERPELGGDRANAIISRLVAGGIPEANIEILAWMPPPGDWPGVAITICRPSAAAKASAIEPR